MGITLYYIHDPMCSWCYAFGPVWQRLQAALPAGIDVVRLLGGLAPDSHSPMGEAMRQRIEATWQRIEKSVPGTHFNFDFWHRCTPYRSTYPACRAVIAAMAQGVEFDEVMTRAIQQAYYQQAQNPSETKTLLDIAAGVGLNQELFAKALGAAETEAELQRQVALTTELGVDSYPSLLLEKGNSRWPIAIDYNDPEPMLETITFLTDE